MKASLLFPEEEHIWNGHRFEVGDLLVGRTPALEDFLKSFLVLECYWDINKVPRYKLLNIKANEVEDHHKVEIELMFVRE